MKEENLKKKRNETKYIPVIVAAVGSDAYRVGEIHEFEITINFAEVRQSPDENVIWSPPDYGQWRIIWDDIWNDQAFSGHVIAGNLYTNSAGDYRTWERIQHPKVFESNQIVQLEWRK